MKAGGKILVGSLALWLFIRATSKKAIIDKQVTTIEPTPIVVNTPLPTPVIKQSNDLEVSGVPIVTTAPVPTEQQPVQPTVTAQQPVVEVPILNGQKVVVVSYQKVPLYKKTGLLVNQFSPVVPNLLPTKYVKANEVVKKVADNGTYNYIIEIEENVNGSKVVRYYSIPKSQVKPY